MSDPTSRRAAGSHRCSGTTTRPSRSPSGSGWLPRMDVESSRHVDPHTLVADGPRWYLVCWDLEREDWRTFRHDRMSSLLRTGVRFSPRPLPVDDLTEMVAATGTDGEVLSIAAVAHLDISLEEARRVFGGWATDATANADGGTDWPLGGNSLADLVYGPAWIPPDVEWRFSGSPGARAVLAEFAAGLARAVAG